MTDSPDTPTAWEGLSPPYATIVADPPWHYDTPIPQPPDGVGRWGDLPYSSLSLDEIKALPVGDLTDNGRCILWVTNAYLRQAWDVLEAWGFIPGSRVFVWCKPRRATMTITTEFFLIGRRGKPDGVLPWHGTTWFEWPRTTHSAKPPAAYDLFESWCPGPYLELFARAPRLGWDSWGFGYETARCRRD